MGVVGSGEYVVIAFLRNLEMSSGFSLIYLILPFTERPYTALECYKLGERNVKVITESNGDEYIHSATVCRDYEYCRKTRMESIYTWVNLFSFIRVTRRPGMT